MRNVSKPLALLCLIILSGCSAARPSVEQCKAVAKAAEAKRLYDEIDQTDMTVFDSFSERDPHTADPRILHEYLLLQDYARAHNTTTHYMTTMERRQVLLDDAIKNDGASSIELTPDERKVLSQCR
jgi:hypothetical protein